MPHRSSSRPAAETVRPGGPGDGASGAAAGRRLRARRRGFTLIEALVSILILSIVMVVAMSLLFTMRSFAERQTYVTAPRQTARRALNYLSYYLSSAGDLNRPPQSLSGFSPNALIMYYNRDEATTGNTAGRNTQVQASYDNLTNAQAAFGDEGTDLLTITVPVSPVTIPLTEGLPGFDKRAAPIWYRFQKFCATTGNAGMYAEFQRLTGVGTAPYQIPLGGVAGVPNPLMILFDANGNWVYYKADTYNNAWADCVSPQGRYAGTALAAGVSGMPDPPGGNLLSGFDNANVQLAAGLQFVTFRVRNATLEQRFGLFDPANPNPVAPDSTFSPVVENVEDLQIAYIYQDGTVRNNAANPIGGAPFSGVPSQAGPCGGAAVSTCDPNPAAANCPCPAGAADIANVIALRVSVTARSLPVPTTALGQAAIRSAGGSPSTILRWYGPDSENHLHTGPITTPPASPVMYQYHRATTTILLRNRALSEGAPLS